MTELPSTDEGSASVEVAIATGGVFCAGLGLLRDCLRQTGC